MPSHPFWDTAGQECVCSQGKKEEEMGRNIFFFFIERKVFKLQLCLPASVSSISGSYWKFPIDRCPTRSAGEGGSPSVGVAASGSPSEGYRDLTSSVPEALGGPVHAYHQSPAPQSQSVPVVLGRCSQLQAILD